jgi:hypothetical protein
MSGQRSPDFSSFVQILGTGLHKFAKFVWTMRQASKKKATKSLKYEKKSQSIY